MADILICNETERTGETLKVLAIGNSFSQDATAFIKQMAVANNCDLRVANAFIGGCSFERHYNNITNGTSDYYLTYYTAEETYTWGNVSLKQCLKMSDWDIITIQQVSSLSGKYETYFPFAPELISYIKALCPDVEIRVHMVWAYARYYPGITNNGYITQDNMYKCVVDAYERFAHEMGDLKIIPSGRAMQIARLAGIGDSLHRDGFHCSELGRILTGWVWFEALTGISALESKFVPKTAKPSYMDKVLISDEEEKILREAAHKAVGEYSKK